MSPFTETVFLATAQALRYACKRMRSPTAIVVALALLTYASAQGVVITPSAINDAYSYKYGTDRIGYYEDGGTIGVQYYFDGFGSNTILAAGFMEFSLAGVTMPAGYTAKLHLYILSASKGTARADALPCLRLV
jgi:hypothetical protein